MSTDLLLSKPDRTDLGLVQDLFDSVRRGLRTALVKRCGGDVDVRPDPPQVRPLLEVLEPADDLAIGATAPFTLSPGNLRGLIMLDVPLVQRLVGLFLGEDPDGVATTPVRRLTRLDLGLASKVCRDILDALLDACTMPEVPTGVVGRLATNPRSVRDLPQSPSVIEVELELGPADAPFGRASVVLPAQAGGVLWPERRSRGKKRLGESGHGLGRVFPIPVLVVAELVRKRVPISELRRLQVGEVLALGSMSDVVLRVGRQATLVGEPGEQDGQRSVRIRGRVPQG